MSDIPIRPASAADLPGLAARLGPEGFFVECLDGQRDGRGLLLVAARDGRPVGSVYLRFDGADQEEIRQGLPEAPLLQHLEVHPDHRNQGIGTELVAAAEETLRERGDELVVLGVHPDNEDAMRLYERLDYVARLPGLIETTRVEYRADGRRVTEPDKCQVYVKRL